MVSRTTRAGPIRQSAFSLTELLVVIGIISVLIGILLPILTRARAQANQVKCAAQLHQLGLALANYATEHDGGLPSWSGWHVYPPGSPEDDPGQAWTEQLAPYYVPPDSPVYDCPSFGTHWITYFLSGRWSASQNRHSMRLTDIHLGAQFVLAGENTNRHLYAPPYGDAVGRTTNDCDQDDATSPCACFPADDGGYLEHPGGNNLLFGDLHVQAFSAFDSNAMTFDPRVPGRAWANVVPTPPPGP